MPTVHEVAESLVDGIRTRATVRESFYVEQVLATRIEPDGTFTVVWSAHGRSHPYGAAWDVRELRRAFSPNTEDVLIDVVWQELDEPNGPGSSDPERAAGLVPDPEAVRWLH